MKPVKNIKSPIIKTTGASCNHKEVCKGDRHCDWCGRRACNACISRRYIREGKGNVCMICAGCYKPDEIILYDEA